MPSAPNFLDKNTLKTNPKTLVMIVKKVIIETVFNTDFTTFIE